MIINGRYFTIRKIDESNIDQVYEIYKQCEDFLALGPVPFASKKMILDDFELSREAGGTFCGIYIDGQMVGIVDFVLSNYDGNPEDAYISLIMISKCHRTKGIGKDVIEAVEARMIENKLIRSIKAGVQTNNEYAIAFWKSIGYKIVSEPELMPDTTICYELRKDIT